MNIFIIPVFFGHKILANTAFVNGRVIKNPRIYKLWNCIYMSIGMHEDVIQVLFSDFLVLVKLCIPEKYLHFIDIQCISLAYIVHIYPFTYVCVYIYIHVYKERESGREI
jgi:hypothetical protein